MQRIARQRWRQNRCDKQLKHGAKGDDIGEQTSKRGVSRSVSRVMTGFTQRRMLPDSQIVFTMVVRAACCVLTWIRMVLVMLCPGYLQ